MVKSDPSARRRTKILSISLAMLEVMLLYLDYFSPPTTSSTELTTMIVLNWLVLAIALWQYLTN